MSLREPKNQHELHTALHAFYEPYAQGIINFPAVRAVGDIDTHPERMRPIAHALRGAWDRIDADREIHKALVYGALKDPEATFTQKDGRKGKGIVVSQIGRNALVETLMVPIGKGKVWVAETTIGPRQAREEYLEEMCIELADGRVITRGGFAHDQEPDVDIRIPRTPDTHGHVVHYDARAV